MGRIIVGTGLGGIAVITAIAWKLADKRISNDCFASGSLCPAEHQHILDHIIVAGLIAALAFIIVSMCVYAVIRARQAHSQGVKPFRSANPADRPLLRP